MAGARGGVARYDVRRVRLHEWEAVRALRIRATGDPDAGVAFLTSREEELARDDSFWQARTAGGALGENAAQFVAIAGGGRWIGTVTVLLRAPGEIDHLGHPLTAASTSTPTTAGRGFFRNWSTLRQRGPRPVGTAP